MLTLHCGGQDPASLRVITTLSALNLKAQTQLINLQQLDNWQTAHRTLAPQGECPVLVDESRTLTDNALIMLYLSERQQNTQLLPQNPEQHYQVQAYIDTMDAAFMDAVNLIGWASTTNEQQRDHFRQQLNAVPNRELPAGWSAVWQDAESDQLARAKDKIVDAINILESALNARTWLVGDAMTLADISIWAQTRTLPTLLTDAVNTEKTPNLLRWLQRMEEQPCCAAALTQTATAAPYAPPR